MYLPDSPEEVGQEHLLRRGRGKADFSVNNGGFDKIEWQKRIRNNPSNYSCLTCNLVMSG